MGLYGRQWFINHMCWDFIHIRPLLIRDVLAQQQGLRVDSTRTLALWSKCRIVKFDW